MNEIKEVMKMATGTDFEEMMSVASELAELGGNSETRHETSPETRHETSSETSSETRHETRHETNRREEDNGGDVKDKAQIGDDIKKWWDGLPCGQKNWILIPGILVAIVLYGARRFDDTMTELIPLGDYILMAGVGLVISFLMAAGSFMGIEYPFSKERPRRRQCEQRHEERGERNHGGGLLSNLAGSVLQAVFFAALLWAAYVFIPGIFSNGNTNAILVAGLLILVLRGFISVIQLNRHQPWKIALALSVVGMLGVYVYHSQLHSPISGVQEWNDFGDSEEVPADGGESYLGLQEWQYFGDAEIPADGWESYPELSDYVEKCMNTMGERVHCAPFTDNEGEVLTACVVLVDENQRVYPISLGEAQYCGEFRTTDGNETQFYVYRADGGKLVRFCRMNPAFVQQHAS